MAEEFTVRAFEGFLREGKLMGSRCRGCGELFLPPRPFCPRCGGRELDWFEFGGEGRVQAYSVVHVPLSRMRDKAPYAVGIVRTEEGPSISGMIVGNPEEISVGSKVKAEFMREKDRTVLCFRLV
jgi:uncharacterized OB-fold protein